LALLLKNGLSVYSSGCPVEKSFYIDCSSKVVEDLNLESLVEVCDVDVMKLVKVEKPSSVMGLWAYYLALKSKG
jgi:hypothetical protein